MEGRQTTSCYMDFSRYPFDHQRCKVGIYIFDQTYRTVNITLGTEVTKEELLGDFQRSLQYEVEKKIL